MTEYFKFDDKENRVYINEFSLIKIYYFNDSVNGNWNFTLFNICKILKTSKLKKLYKYIFNNKDFLTMKFFQNDGLHLRQLNEDEITFIKDHIENSLKVRKEKKK